MFGSSFTRGVGLCGVSLLALGSLGDAALAGSETREKRSVYDDSYTGPPVIRRIPGLRILFGDSDQAEEAYVEPESPKKKKKKGQIDESYYEPAPVQPGKPKAVKPPANTAAKPPANPALPQKSAAATPAKPLAEGPLSCEKATSVVSGFGFSSVEASSCAGKVYAFNAKRGGNSFAIKLDPTSGELTEVKKLP